MVELTIRIPDELASRLHPVRDRLTEVIELGLREIAPAQYDLYSEVIEFLASGPTPQAITAFRPSAEAQARVAELLDKNRASTLTPSEEAELDQYENLDCFMTLVKARVHKFVGEPGGNVAASQRFGVNSKSLANERSPRARLCRRSALA
ncbi:MAG: hypothetical protein ACE5LU_07565 [Anaerolineae bacterium]